MEVMSLEKLAQYNLAPRVVKKVTQVPWSSDRHRNGINKSECLFTVCTIPFGEIK